MEQKQRQQQHHEKGDERIQTVMFLRHGVAKHNLMDPMTGLPPNIHDPSYWDPPLVDRGMHQALAVRERLSRIIHTSVDMVVTSPLTRCMQTAHLVFFPGHSYDRPTTNPHPPPIVCLEQVREAYGMHYPDKRRDKRLLQQHWPFIQFDRAMTDLDEKWSETSRETLDDVVKRVDEFLQWIVRRDETHIFVVSHGVWIESCFNAHFPEVLQGGQRVHNCDCFIGEVVSKEGKFLRLEKLRKL